VRDRRGRSHEGYFDSLASAFFVLKERYGQVEVLEIGVPEYAGRRHAAHGHEGHGLIDGFDAWYFWDTDHHARGGLPLIYSFYSRSDARDFSRRHDGEIMDFEEVVYHLKNWHERARSRVYWRGWHTDRWTNSSWNNAWNRRWQGYGWDRNDGWRLRVNVDRDGDINVRDIRYRNNGVGVVVRNDDNGRGRNNNGRGRGSDRGRGRDRDRDEHRDHDHDDDDRGRDRDDDRGRDDNGKYERERSRERNR
jgi:hypothetical protein